MTERTCEQCGNPLKRQKRFCSRICLYKALSQKTTRVCVQCGGTFMEPPSNKAKLCSEPCRRKWQSKTRIGKNAANWRGGNAMRICERCDGEFEVRLSVVKKGKGRFCSIPCKAKWMAEVQVGTNHPSWKGGKVKLSCAQCGKEFEVAQGRVDEARFCSCLCHGRWRSENQIRENHPMWRGGISYEPYGLEFDAKLKESIRERDAYICAICGKFGKCVHHIDYDKKNNHPANLITLCRKDHCKTTTGERDYWQGYFASKWLLVKNWWGVSPANLGAG